MLVEALAQVEFLLPALMLVEHLLNKLNIVGLVVCVCDENIKDKIRALFIEFVAHYFPTEIFLLCE